MMFPRYMIADTLMLSLSVLAWAVCSVLCSCCNAGNGLWLWKDYLIAEDALPPKLFKGCRLALARYIWSRSVVVVYLLVCYDDCIYLTGSLMPMSLVHSMCTVNSISSRGLLGVFQFLGPVQFCRLTRIGCSMFLRPLPAHECDLPFDLWLERHVDVRHNPQLVAFFKCIARFTLSLELSQISIAEVVRITKNMLRYGAPGIVQGGCGELTRQLEQQLLAQGGELLLAYDVRQILSADGLVTGVRVCNKQSGEEMLIHASLVVSDIGPRATTALLDNRRVTQADVLKRQNTASEETGQAEPTLQEAIGLKVHVLSDVSLIPHKGIMYCLDTKRIAGMVQPTNSDPGLAPPGKHLLISHQVIQSNNIAEERTLALADLHMLFGKDFFAQHCRVLTMGTYRGEWPVNRIAQGEDVRAQTATQGLYLVGDAVKPSGYLMVEGVAQSVNRFLDLVEASDQQQVPLLRKAYARNETPPPSRLNALLWLWKAPGNSSK